MEHATILFAVMRFDFMPISPITILNFRCFFLSLSLFLIVRIRFDLNWAWHFFCFLHNLFRLFLIVTIFVPAQS